MNPENYNSTYPNWPPLVQHGRWVYGVWIIGSNYRAKHKYYGEYPPTYLARMRALFPDARRVLHLFSGVVDKGLWPYEKTLDIQIPDDYPGHVPDYICDAHEMSEHIDEKFDLILADPPYSEEDAKHYGMPMINRNKVMKECAKVLDKGGHLVWLDQVFPMFRKKELELVGTIGLIRSTNHRIRTVFIFKRV